MKLFDESRFIAHLHINQVYTFCFKKEKPITKDQLSMNPKHKQSSSIQDRNRHRHIAAEPRESGFGQSRCISANHDFRLLLPKCFVKLYPLFPYGKAYLAWRADSTRYHADFHGRSVVRMPCIKIRSAGDHLDINSFLLFLFFLNPHDEIANRIAHQREPFLGPNLLKQNDRCNFYIITVH